MPIDIVDLPDRSLSAPTRNRLRTPAWLVSAFGRIWASGPLLLTASSLFWSGNFIVARAIQNQLTPIGLSFWRWLGALLILAVLAARHLRRDFAPLRREWRRVLLLAALGVAAMNTMYYVGLQSTTAVNALLLQSAVPFLVLGCTAAVYGERPRPRQVVAILVSLLGVLAIVLHGDAMGIVHGLSFRNGDLWIVGGGLCYAGYTTVLRRRPAVHPTSLLVATVAVGVVLLAPPVVVRGLVDGPALPSRGVVLAVAYLAVLPSVVAFLCLNRGVELLGANQAGQYVHLLPVFGIAMAMLFLGERLQPHHVAGAALIAGGLLMARGLPARLSRAWIWLWACYRRALDRQVLRQADPGTLRDLGPSRVTHESEKPFWLD